MANKSELEVCLYFFPIDKQVCLYFFPIDKHVEYFFHLGFSPDKVKIWKN